MNCITCAVKTFDVINEILHVLSEDNALDRDIAMLKLVLDTFDVKKASRISNRDWESLRVAFESAIQRIEARLVTKLVEEEVNAVVEEEVNAVVEEEVNAVEK